MTSEKAEKSGAKQNANKASLSEDNWPSFRNMHYEITGLHAYLVSDIKKNPNKTKIFLFYLKEVFILSRWRAAAPQAGAPLQGQILYAAATPSSSSFFPTDHEILSKTGPEKK